MTDITLIDRLPNGLPDTLEESDSNGALRLFHLLPHPDRSYRRWIARLARQKIKFDGSDTEVLVRFFGQRRMRQQHFWSAIERVQKGTFKHDSFPFSLDLILLQKIDDGDPSVEFDEFQFVEQCAEWPTLKANIERLTERSFDAVPPMGLRPLMLWPLLRDRISQWKDDELKDWPTLEAIFSLSSITDSPWFLNQAMTLSSNCKSRLTNVLQRCTTTSPDPVASYVETDEGSHNLLLSAPPSSKDPIEMIHAGTDWRAIARKIAEVGTIMAKQSVSDWSGQRTEMIIVLQDAVSALTRFDSNDEARAQLNKALAEFRARLIELPQQPNLDSIIPGGRPTSSTRGRGKLLHPDAVNRRRSAPS